ncbi:hypothetical protein BH10PSE1_BH10PSE1_01370 [soil metagenome]
MADPTKAPEEAPHFETDDVDANRAIEQGLGIGARELAAQREPGGVVTADEDEAVDGVSVNAGDADTLDEDLGVQGAEDDDQQLSANSDA